MPESLTWIDILAAVAIGFGLVKGLSNGLVKELAGLIGLIIGIWAGFRFAFLFAEYYRENFEVPESIIPVIAFLTAFILALAAVITVGRMLRFILKKASLSLFDKMAGALFGSLKLAFIVGTLISLVGKSGIIAEETKAKSVSYNILTTYCEGVNEYSIALIPKAKNVFTELDLYFTSLDSLKLPAPTENNSNDSDN